MSRYFARPQWYLNQKPVVCKSLPLIVNLPALPEAVRTGLSEGHPVVEVLLSFPVDIGHILSPFCPSLPLPQWCESHPECRRLQLKDLQVAPLQRLTRYPLLLRNICKRSSSEEQSQAVEAVVEIVDRSIRESAHSQLSGSACRISLGYMHCNIITLTWSSTF